MLTLAFICRVLLTAVLSELAQPADKSQFLISENMWPRGCVLDCTRGRQRAVCGSNGRLYKSLCAFQRAQCINSQLRAAPHTHCTGDPLKSKCQLARSQALQSVARSEPVVLFIPECSPDGSFSEVQCHNQTGYCWCSTPDGKPVSGSSVLHHRPNCTSLRLENPEETKQGSELSDGDVQWRPTPDPGQRLPLAAVGITAPPFWVTIQLNSDPGGNRSLKRPSDSSPSCEKERAALLTEAQAVWVEERFIPECSADGRYSPIQCHASTGYCWCVRVDTGRPLPGTSTRNRLPDCSPEKASTGIISNSYRDRPLAGCPGARRTEFLQSLMDALQQEAWRATDETPSSSPPSPSPQSGVSGGAEDSLRSHFLRLDADGDGGLSEREARPLRLFLRRRLRPRRCAKKLLQHCDADGDGSLRLRELSSCLGL